MVSASAGACRRVFPNSWELLIGRSSTVLLHAEPVARRDYVLPTVNAAEGGFRLQRERACVTQASSHLLVSRLASVPTVR